MEPEYRLDTLLALRERPRRTPSDPSPMDEELAPLLAAADRLAPLRRAAPAPDFARVLGEQLRARTDHLREVQAQGILAQGIQGQGIQTARGHTPSRAQTGPDRPGPRPTTTAGRNWRAPALLRPALGAAAALLIGVGIATSIAAAQAGPDSPLYVVRRVQQGVQVQLASSEAQRVQDHISFATEALGQLDAAARNHDNSTYATALGTLTSEAAAASQALDSVPAGSDHDTLAAQIADLQSNMRQDLAANLSAINWENRVSTTKALGALQVSVPHVTSATVVRQGDSHDDSHGTVPRGDQVTVRGSGFAAGAALVVNGRTMKVVTLTVTSTQLVAVLATGSDDADIEHPQTIGISNPDGTAAQTTNITVQTPPGTGGGGDNGGDATPRPGATPSATPSGTRTPDDHGP